MNYYVSQLNIVFKEMVDFLKSLVRRTYPIHTLFKPVAFILVGKIKIIKVGESVVAAILGLRIERSYCI